MTARQPIERDPLHLLILRTLVYAGAVLLFVTPLAVPAGLVAALAAVPAGVWLGPRLAVARWRSPVVMAALVGLVILGIKAEALVGGPVWIPQLLGIKATLLLGQVLTFGLVTLGLVLGLRCLASRWPALAVLEGVAVAAVVVIQFAGHRDYRIDQPRDLSDWALSQGYYPLSVIMGIGLAVLGGLALLFLQRQKLARTLSNLLVLLIFCLLGALFVPAWSGGREHNSPGAGGASDSPLMEADPNKDPNTFEPTKGQMPRFLVAVVTLHDDFTPAEKGYYFRSRTYSKFNGHRLVPSDRPEANRDAPKEFPKTLMLVNGTDLFEASAFLRRWATLLAHPPGGPEGPLSGYRFAAAAPQVINLKGFGDVPLFRIVPMTVTLLTKQLRPFGLVGPLTIEPRPNPDPKRFVQAYGVCSRVLVTPVIPAYWMTSESVRKLRGAGVPADVLTRLDILVQKKLLCTEPWFREVLNMKLTPAQVGRYQTSIMAVCRTMIKIDPYQAFQNCRAGNPLWSAALRQEYLGMPNDPRYRRLSDQIVAGMPSELRQSPLLRARAIQQWFWENTIYSLTSDHTHCTDPTADYLFGDRRGKCVHIAHAMALLLRSQGIPSRVAGGYHVPLKRRGQGSSLLVQSTDGHAWCEVYLEGVGWVVLDAGSRRHEPASFPEPSRELQRQMGEQARLDNPGNPETEPAPNQWKQWLPLGLGLAIAVVLAGLYLIKVWRRLAPRFVGPGQLYRVGYRAALDRLAEVGLYRRFGETREEFAERLSGLAPEFVELSQAHLHQAVGGLEAVDRLTWNALSIRMKGRLVETFSFLRRALGVLNPVTWAWVS